MPLKKETFGDRLNTLRGNTSYRVLADKLKEHGVRTTPAGIHKWVRGGGIAGDNLLALARYFDISPMKLFLGEDDHVSPIHSDEAKLIGYSWQFIPERFRAPYRAELLRLGLAFAPKNGDGGDHFLQKQLEREVALLPTEAH